MMLKKYKLIILVFVLCGVMFCFFALQNIKDAVDTNETVKAQEIDMGYVILEPEKWIGENLPVIDYIDIGEQLKTGDWLVLFFHYDCSDCIEAIEGYEQIAKDLEGNGDFLQIAFIELPHYGAAIVDRNNYCVTGKLLGNKEWLITTPTTILMTNSNVTKIWESDIPDFATILNSIAIVDKNENEILTTLLFKESKRWIM